MITSVQNPRIQRLSQLKKRKERVTQKAFLAEGRHLVQEAVQAGIVKEIFCLENAVLPPYDGKVSVVSERVLNALCETQTPQDMVAYCDFPKLEIDWSHASRLVVLDGIQDPGNLGTIIRTSLAFAMDGVILLDGTADPFAGKVVRSAQGALFQIPVLSLNFSEALELLENHGFEICVTAPHDALPLARAVAAEKMALVFGSEGSGVRPAFFDVGQQFITIPLVKAESLNVAVAAGIILYHFQKNNEVFH